MVPLLESALDDYNLYYSLEHQTTVEKLHVTCILYVTHELIKKKMNTE